MVYFMQSTIHALQLANMWKYLLLGRLLHSCVSFISILNENHAIQNSVYIMIIGPAKYKMVGRISIYP